jgi:hypothetical protein
MAARTFNCAILAQLEMKVWRIPAISPNERRGQTQNKEKIVDRGLQKRNGRGEWI